MQDIADIMKKYHGYMCKKGEHYSPRQVLPEGGTVNISTRVETIEYTPCFLPGLSLEEEKLIATHLNYLFGKCGVEVIQGRNSRTKEILEKARGIKERTDKVKKGNFAGNTKITFRIPLSQKDGAFKIIDGVHERITCPEREFVVDNVRNIVIMNAMPS